MARVDMGGLEFAGAGPTTTAESLYELGLIYATGRDGVIDIISAHKWFNLAAFRGSEDAKVRREELAAEMNRDEILAAQKAAREWVGTH